ncbi:hypothetical protein QPK87_08620 [Kamptonema cortianum]|nr:hypothetical protein [Kamptonema cortianum]
MNSIHYNTAYSDPPENAWLWFHCAGHFHVDEKYGITVPNGYFASTIFLTVNGSGRYSWNKTEHDDQPHSITILPEGKIRNGWRTAVKPWDFYWALYRGGRVPLLRGAIRNHPACLQCPRAPKMDGHLVRTL